MGKGNNSAANQRSNSMNPNNSAYRSSSNNRSNTFNPTSSTHRAAHNNRSNQLNPTSSAYKSNVKSGISKVSSQIKTSVIMSSNRVTNVNNKLSVEESRGNVNNRIKSQQYESDNLENMTINDEVPSNVNSITNGDIIEHKILELKFDMPEVKKILQEKYDGNFTLYLESVLDEYVNNGWDILSPNILANTFGNIFKAIFVFQRLKR